MKFFLEISDTINGIRCTAAYKPNEVSDSLENSLSAKVVANFSTMLRELEDNKVLYVEKD